MRAFATGTVALVSTHPAYDARCDLSAETRSALLGDLEGRIEPLPLG